MKRIRSLTLAALAIVFPTPPLAAQEAGNQPTMSAEQQTQMQAWMAAMTPGAPHAALAERVGKWTVKMTLAMEPGAPATEASGTAEREMVLGGRVLVERFRADMGGMPMEGLGLSGYDNVTSTHWSTWTDNLSTALTKNEGKTNTDGSITYQGTMTDPATREARVVRIVTRNVSKDQDTMEMYETRDGKEWKSLALVYERVK